MGGMAGGDRTRYFYINDPMNKKHAMIIFGGRELTRLEKSLPNPTDEGMNDYDRQRSKLNVYSVCEIFWKEVFRVSPRCETPSYKYYFIRIEHSFGPKMCRKNFENRFTNKKLMSKNAL